MNMARLFQGILIALLVASASLGAEPGAAPERHHPTASLLLTPARCVALHQGQTCYQQVQIFWSTSQVGNYCLYQQEHAEPLHCWQGQTQGDFAYEFAGEASRQLQLRDAGKMLLAESTLEVAWVYKASSRRKTHWRLF